MNDSFLWGKKADGEIVTHGIELGGKITELYRNGRFAVWHIRGSMAWNGRGQARSYYETRYYLVADKGQEGERTRSEFKREVTAAQKWRRVRAELIALCDALAAREKTHE